MAISHTAKIFLSIQAQDFIEELAELSGLGEMLREIPEHSSLGLH